MRRNLVSQFKPVILRKGVTASEISRNTSVRIPVVRVTNSRGFAPTCFRYTSVSSSASGTTALTKRTSLVKRKSFMSVMERGHPCPQSVRTTHRPTGVSCSALMRAQMPALRLIIRPQIHSLVKMANLLRIAIEQKGRARAILADAVLHPLAIAWVRDIRIHVGIKPVRRRPLYVPGRRGLIRHQTNLHNRLDALESVFPGRNQANWRAILRRQRLAIKPRRQNRQGIQGFVQPQAFNIRPGKHAGVLVRQTLRIEQGLKSHVTRRRKWIDDLQERAERKSHPWNHHRPAFDAAKAVNSLFLWRQLQQSVEIERFR